MAKSLLLICFMGLAFAFVAADNSPLQDFCVADAGSSVLVNGLACKDPKTVQADDFSFSGLLLPGNTSNPYGASFTPVTVHQLPGLNTLGLSLGRAEYAPQGITPPHIHPRATELVLVLEGTLEVGFITSLPDNRLLSKTLQKGDVFVVPPGLIHHVRNNGTENAVAIVAFGSQNPGFILIPTAVFGSTPHISLDILAKSFQVDQTVVSEIQSKF